MVRLYNLRLWFVLLLGVMSLKANASIEVYEFDDPKLEKRFNHLIFVLRCPKCQNQNLADSNSELSMDLKQIVYEKLKQGESDEEILLFMKQRYGEFILFKPEMTKSNMVLWFGPIIFLIAFILLFLRWYRKNRVNFDD